MVATKPDFKPILIVQTAFLGDLVLTTALFKNLRQLWPGHPLILVCRQGVGSWVRDLKLVEEIFEIKKGNAKSYRRLKNHLSSRSFFRIYCPHQSLRSAMFVRALRAEKKIGFKTWTSFFTLDTAVVRNLELPDALRQLSLLGSEFPELQEKISQYAKEFPSSMIGPVPAWSSLDCRDSIPDCRIPTDVVIFPGSVWATKQWTLNGFQELTAKFLARGNQVTLMGGPQEKKLGEAIAQTSPEVKNLIGSTGLLETLSLLKNAKLVISNDSGGQHLASLAGVPTVSIFGPTVLSLGYRPWNPQTKVVEMTTLSCRPCGKHGHQKCPLGTHECMQKISSNRVLEAALQFFKTPEL